MTLNCEVVDAAVMPKCRRLLFAGVRDTTPKLSERTCFVSKETWQQNLEMERSFPVALIWETISGTKKCLIVTKG